jgi:hypothetical protein
MLNSQNFGTPFSVTATHATAAVASKGAVASTRYYITDIAASSDKAGAIILVKQGTTVLWQDIVGAGSYRMSFLTPLIGAVGALVSVEIDGTSACKANINGYAILTS